MSLRVFRILRGFMTSNNKHTRTYSTDLGRTYGSTQALFFSGVILCNKYMQYLDRKKKKESIYDITFTCM
jgi:hypothetical protein